MAFVHDTTCMFSVVKNISGASRFFPFLPPHGAELANNGEYSVFGNVLEAISRSNDRFGDRDKDGLLAEVDAGNLEIRSTPAPILTDATTDDIKTITLNAGSLVVSKPCFEISLS